MLTWYIVTKGLSHMALSFRLLEATPSRSTRVNSPWCVTSRSNPLTCPHVLSIKDVSSCALNKGPWAIGPIPLIPSRISVIIDQLNSFKKEYDLEYVAHGTPMWTSRG
jgi:hypothetical protein